MPSPAERYAKSKYKKLDFVSDFVSGLAFYPDDFQIESFAVLERGESLLVAAPTGAGKTLIAEYGIQRCLELGKKLVYTTPIKALSNQKYRDFCSQFGEDKIGLLTGDRKINSDAQIVVMTTEILRNMLYSDSNTSADIATVVMDEVHYLSDRSRGSVWEECLILLPEKTQILCLSATVSNAEEFGSWLRSIRGNLTVILSEKRPIPLEQLVFKDGSIYPLFSGAKNVKELKINPVLLERSVKRRPKANGFKFRGVSDNERALLIRLLLTKNELPAIYFIFSRKLCDSATKSLLNENLQLNSKVDSDYVQKYISRRVSMLSSEELDSLNFQEFEEMTIKGVATHHAGMIPLFKEIVEELFQMGYIKIVFATETLSLGINMPARSVIIESLRKFNGTSHVDITPGEYTQLTGRAGRRGIDDIGYAVVPITNFISPQSVASLASTRTYPLKSSFQPSYNMTINLIDKYGIEPSLEILNKSFAQFQRTKNLYQEEEKLKLVKKRITELSQKHELSNFELAMDYCLKDEEMKTKKRQDLIASFSPNQGQSFKITSGTIGYFRNNPSEIFIIIGIDYSKKRVSYITKSGGYLKRSIVELDESPIIQGRIGIPRGFNPRDKIARKKLFTKLNLGGLQDNTPSFKDLSFGEIYNLYDHPVHSLSSSALLLKDAQKVTQLKKDRDKIESRINSKLDNLSSLFKSIYSLLAELNFLSDTLSPTRKGEWLRSIYSESDLLICESLVNGLLDDLNLAELASILSAFVYEGRYRDEVQQISAPSARIKNRLQRIGTIQSGLEDRERVKGLKLIRPIDTGFTVPIYDWVSGNSIESILYENDLSPGDFVRWIKQVMDLCNQLSLLNIPSELKINLKKLALSLNYGIVAASDLDSFDIE